MKNILLILLILLTFNLNSQIKTDKVAHFGVGYISGVISSGIVLTNTDENNQWAKSLSVSFGTSLAIGTAKELYDYKSYGKFNVMDLGATVLGGGFGGINVKFIINRYEKKYKLCQHQQM